jgi:ABC-type multidrug transport system ATPase subunit
MTRAHASVEVEAQIVSLPTFFFKIRAADGLVTALSFYFVPILSMLFFPTMLQTVLMEKVERQLVSMRIQSLRAVNYWVSTYLWNLFLYFLVVGLYFGVNYIVGIPEYVYALHGWLFLAFFCWGHAQISVAIFSSAFLGRSKLTTVFAYTVILGTAISSTVVGEAIKGRWPLSLIIFPPFAFIRTFTLLLRMGGQANLPTLGGDQYLEVRDTLAIEFCVGTVLLVVGITKHTLDAEEISVGSLLGGLLRGKKEPPAFSRELDVDVSAEEARVEKEGEDTVRIQHAVKSYPNGYLAVKDVSIGIPTGECFGLLGPNGAGKTTLISALSGTTSLTKGLGRICGFDVKTQMRDIHKVLGVCPQFDVVWDELTVHEHLLLYARIKGMKKEEAIVRKVAEAVQLDGDPYNTQAGLLSGGMRRRLSLAIALVANPRVIFLDEPSTGLDPDTRQSLWKIVSRLKKDRCVILTTHSMEEADALSQRIGIMAAGYLRCLGPPLHLKNKFGKGYQLMVTLRDVDGKLKANRKAFEELVKSEVAREATVQDAFKGDRVLSILLPKDVQISRVFSVLGEATLTQYGISEWSIAQTSLNDVFLRIAEEAEEHAAGNSGGKRASFWAGP